MEDQLDLFMYAAVSAETVPGGDPMQGWRAERELRMEELRRRTGLPLGREVEVWLGQGVRLRGKLCLQDEDLLTPESERDRIALCIGTTNFRFGEMESVVRC